MESREFWLTSPAYVKQVGQSEPEYLNASPSAPLKVILPAKIERRVKDPSTGVIAKKVIDHPEHDHLKYVDAGMPEVPKNAVSPVGPKKGNPAGAQPVAKDGVRAADK